MPPLIGLTKVAVGDGVGVGVEVAVGTASVLVGAGVGCAELTVAEWLHPAATKKIIPIEAANLFIRLIYHLALSVTTSTT